MATDIKVPEMGESVTEGTIARWFKAVGDAVAADEAIVEIETDKVTVEVPAPVGGVLESISAEEGADVEVGSIIGAIDESASAPAKKDNGSGGDAKAEAEAKSSEDKPAAKSEPEKTEAAASKSGGGENIDIVVPELGESVSEGTVGRWLKKPGEAVKKDEALVEIETDKVTAELPSPADGTLASIAAEEGTDVEVGAVVGTITTGDAPAASSGGSDESKKADDKPAAKSEPAPAESKAANLDYPLAPAVRKLVDEHGLDPAKIKASGRDGRLTKADVLNYIDSGAGKSGGGAAKSAPAPSAPSGPVFTPADELPEREPDPRGEERVRMTKLRQTIATRLKEAQHTAAMLTTFNEVDMQAVMDLRSRYRDQFEKKHGVKLGFMSFFVKACVEALKELPAVNAEIFGDEIIYKNFYDIGIAVGGPQGLVVPVLRDADERSFADIEGAIGDFGVRARDGKLSLKELTGGTFTITNGGIFGSMLSTPIINPPQSAILGMHNIVKRAVVIDDEIVIRPMMYLALSYDHRIIDGREAVTFLVKVKQAIEDPERLLLGV